MTKIALDTNIAIDILNGKENVIKRMSTYEYVFIPVIVIGELLFGAKNSTKSKKNLTKYISFIDSLIELPINSFVSEEYANIRLQLKLKGRPIPENDIWIAAICKVNGLSLYTNDKHFSYVDGLVLEY